VAQDVRVDVRSGVKRGCELSTVAKHLGKRFGYSCQAWLAIDIANRFFHGAHRPWFATSLNPQLNGSSSNPLIIFQELDRIVHTNDFNHGRVEQLRRRLSNWITGSSLAAPDIAALLAEIVDAPVPAFRPELWKIDLSNIHISRLINLGQFPDEYLLRDLIAGEIQVMVP
jgi:hypothetical protein